MRAIDADELLDRAIKERRFVVATKDIINQEITIRTAYKDLYEFIKQAPTLTLDDLRPHGDWVVERKHSHGKFSHCSECLTAQLTADTKKMRYCPSCGADMRGGGEDG